MTDQDFLDKMTPIFRDVFDNEELIITEATNADDIEDWDSLSNIQLIVQIEKKFGVKFKSSEITQFEHIGDIITAIKQKL
jgi:acyl carrier protein